MVVDRDVITFIESPFHYFAPFFRLICHANSEAKGVEFLSWYGCVCPQVHGELNCVRRVRTTKNRDLSVAAVAVHFFFTFTPSQSHNISCLGWMCTCYAHSRRNDNSGGGGRLLKDNLDPFVDSCRGFQWQLKPNLHCLRTWSKEKEVRRPRTLCPPVSALHTTASACAHNTPHIPFAKFWILTFMYMSIYQLSRDMCRKKWSSMGVKHPNEPTLQIIPPDTIYHTAHLISIHGRDLVSRGLTPGWIRKKSRARQLDLKGPLSSHWNESLMLYIFPGPRLRWRHLSWSFSTPCPTLKLVAAWFTFLWSYQHIVTVVIEDIILVNTLNNSALSIIVAILSNCLQHSVLMSLVATSECRCR